MATNSVEFSAIVTDNTQAGLQQVQNNLSSVVQKSNNPSLVDSANTSSITNNVPLPAITDTQHLIDIKSTMTEMVSLLRDILKGNKSGAGTNGIGSSNGDFSGGFGGGLIQGGIKYGTLLGVGAASQYAYRNRIDAGNIRAGISYRHMDGYGAQMQELNAEQEYNQSVASAVGNGGMAVGGALMMLNPVAGAIVAGGAKAFESIYNLITGSNTAKELAILEDKKDRSDAYGRYLPTDIKYRAFYGGYRDENIEFINSMARGTNLSIEDFAAKMMDFSKHTGSNEDMASLYVKTSNDLSRLTGNDMNTTLQLGGVLSRFTKEDSDSLYRIYASARTAGMGKSQLDEFLQGLQGVIESGIAKGYVKSSKEVSDTMIMFSQLSNKNELWEGQQGYNRLNQMNSGLQNATSLSNTSQILGMRAISSYYDSLTEEQREALLGDSYIKGNDDFNKILLMRRGITAANFNYFKNTFDSVYGNDSTSYIKSLQQIFGFDEDTAAQMYNMMKSGDYNASPKFDFLNEAKKIVTNDETAYKAVENAITVRNIVESAKEFSKDGKTGRDLYMENIEEVRKQIGDTNFDSNIQVDYSSAPKDMLFFSKLMKKYKYKGGIADFFNAAFEANGLDKNDPEIKRLYDLATENHSALKFPYFWSNIPNPHPEVTTNGQVSKDVDFNKSQGARTSASPIDPKSLPSGVPVVIPSDWSPTPPSLPGYEGYPGTSLVIPNKMTDQEVRALAKAFSEELSNTEIRINLTSLG